MLRGSFRFCQILANTRHRQTQRVWQANRTMVMHLEALSRLSLEGLTLLLSLSFPGRGLKLGKHPCHLSSLALVQDLTAEPHSIINVRYLTDQRIFLLISEFDGGLIRPLH